MSITVPTCVNVNQGAPVPIDAIVSGGAGGYTYLWTPPTGLDDPTAEDVTATPDTTTTYNVTVTDAANDTASDAVTVHLIDRFWSVQNDCDAVQWPDGSGAPDPDWDYSNGGRTVCQSENAAAGAHICPAVIEDSRVRGTITVDENEDDDDTIGLIWGYQDPNNFYVLSWKKAFQDTGHPTNCPSGNIPAGIAIKRVQGTNVDTFDIVCAEDTANSVLLKSPAEVLTTGWEAGETYRFELSYTATESTIVIRRVSDNALIVTTTVVDSTFPSGKAGPYSQSQPDVCTSNWFTTCL